MCNRVHVYSSYILTNCLLANSFVKWLNSCYQIFSEVLSQDPLENYFGNQWEREDLNENSNAA